MDDRGFILDSDASISDVYSTLGPNELRVLLLAPGKKDSPILCEMQIVSGPKSFQYEALSYVWGDTDKSKSISCNGFEFAVTESLYTALHHMRYSDSWRRLWVDQLCINQQRDDELRIQVGQMGTIYSSASRVIVWLGKYDQKMAMAWELLQETTLSSSLVRSDFLQSSSAPSTPRRTPSTPRRQSSNSTISKYSSRSTSSRASSSRESLSSSISSINSITPTRPKTRRHDTPPTLKHALSIFQHIWFDRKWTFQEIILAKAAIICCGDLEMAWGDLTAWYFHYASKLRGSSLLYDSHGSFENVMNIRNEMGKGKLNLSNLLMLTRPRSSLKAEDAIYALLGLLPGFSQYLAANNNTRGSRDGRSSEVEVLFDLYLQAFKYCLEMENALTILSAAGKYKGNKDSPGWPSWLPDWRQQLPLRPLILTDSSTLGPEASFDEETFGPIAHEEVEVEQKPVYKLNLGSGYPLPYSNDDFTLTVEGIRLGCLALRVGSWPSTFLIPERTASTRLQSLKSSTSGEQYSRSITELVSSAQSLQAGGKFNNYAERLTQKCLKHKVQCQSVRTSATVQPGDWLCALHGGKVLYALRPLDEVNPTQPSLRARARTKFKNSHKRLGSSGKVAPPLPPSTHANRSIRCIFIGECAMHGIYPSDILEHNSEHTLEFELV